MKSEVRLGVFSEKAFSLIAMALGTAYWMMPMRCTDNEVAVVPSNEEATWNTHGMSEAKRVVVDRLREWAESYQKSDAKTAKELLFLAGYIESRKGDAEANADLVGSALDPFKTETIQLLEKKKASVKKKYQAKIKEAQEKFSRLMTKEMLEISEQIKQIRGDSLK